MPWDDVPMGSCVEAWLNRFESAGEAPDCGESPTIELVKQDYYRVSCCWQFMTIHVPTECDEDCMAIQNRVNKMTMEGVLKL